VAANPWRSLRESVTPSYGTALLRPTSILFWIRCSERRIPSMLLALMAGGLPARQGTSRVQSRFSSHATIPAAATYATLLARLGPSGPDKALWRAAASQPEQNHAESLKRSLLECSSLKFFITLKRKFASRCGTGYLSRFYYSCLSLVGFMARSRKSGLNRTLLNR